LRLLRPTSSRTSANRMRETLHSSKQSALSRPRGAREQDRFPSSRRKAYSAQERGPVRKSNFDFLDGDTTAAASYNDVARGAH
jgi:hypothetical protein